MESETLKVKVEEALREALRDDPDAVVDVTPEPSGMISGFAISKCLAELSPAERQDHIWKYLDAALTPRERSQIVFIVAETPVEHAALTGTDE